MRAKKRFGQNFITDKTLLNELVELVRISPEDEILEIGPGKGDLSELILNNCAYYHGVELDRDLYLLLKKKFSNHEILFSNEDILKFNISESLEKTKIRLLGNIPYNISSPILKWCEKNYETVTDIHFMLQKEFALRCTGSESSTSYGKLSVICNYLYEMEILKEIDQSYFTPKPKVDSAFVRFKPKHKNIDLVEIDNLSLISSLLFNQKRKKISNSLKGVFDKKEIDKININLDSRPDELNLDDYLELASHLNRYG